MTARMQELLRLLTLVVGHVRTAAERADRAEACAAERAALLDAMAAENAALRHDLARTDAAAEAASAEIRGLRDRAEAAERLNTALEARAAEAELRILRAAQALGLPALGEAPRLDEGEGLPSAALH